MMMKRTTAAAAVLLGLAAMAVAGGAQAAGTAEFNADITAQVGACEFTVTPGKSEAIGTYRGTPGKEPRFTGWKEPKAFTAGLRATGASQCKLHTVGIRAIHSGVEGKIGNGFRNMPRVPLGNGHYVGYELLLSDVNGQAAWGPDTGWHIVSSVTGNGTDDICKYKAIENYARYYGNQGLKNETPVPVPRTTNYSVFIPSVEGTASELKIGFNSPTHEAELGFAPALTLDIYDGNEAVDTETSFEAATVTVTSTVELDIA